MPQNPLLRGAALGAAALLAALAFAATAGATARTWISGIGDDSNPCSLTAPCKTLAGAISKTDAGGIINAMSPGGFGAVAVTKSITIDLSGSYSSVLNTLGNGIIVNAPTANVVLRGLTIDGGPTTGGPCALGGGLAGILVRDAASVRIEDVTITGQATAGISIAPTTTDPAVYVSGASISESCGPGIGVSSVTGRTTLMVTGSSVFATSAGLSVGDGVASWLQGSTITGNGVGLAHAGSGTIDSYADNVIAGNGVDGAATTQRSVKGDTGAAGPAGVVGAVGPAGPVGATGPAAFKLVVAPLATKLSVKAGSAAKLKYVATAVAKATLTVTKGTKKVATVSGSVISGTNAITWRTSRKTARGTYALALKVVGSDGQTTTTKASAKVR